MKFVYRYGPVTALLLCLTLSASAADNACANGVCGASGLSLKALDAAARENQPASSSVLREALRRPQSQGDAWTRNLGARDDREAYNCALSFGVGGQLSKDGFIGSRVLGQTQVWRSPEREAKPIQP